VKILCPQEEAEKVQDLLDKVNHKYDEVKADIRNRFVVGILREKARVDSLSYAVIHRVPLSNTCKGEGSKQSTYLGTTSSSTITL